MQSLLIPVSDFRNLFESAPGLYLVLTIDLKIVAASDAYLRATKSNREDIIGHDFFEIFPDNPNDPEATGKRNLKASLERALELKRTDFMPVQQYDIRKPQNEGGEFEVRYWSPINSPVFDANGNISYIIHRVEDVTEFIKIKKERSEQQRVNEALRDRTERMESEIFLRAQEVARVARDISERKKIEGQLKTSLQEVSLAKKIAEKEQKKAQVANQVKDDFLANMSHEIRTPLNSMIGLTELLLETELNPQQENMLSVVLQSGETLLEIINDLLDFSKIESGMLELESAPFDLQAAIEETLDLFAPLARDKENPLELLFHFIPGTPRYMIGDVGRIRQILSNLLNNAVKFTQEGHVLILVEEIKEESFSDYSKIKISVEDTGIGIPEDKQHIIFDKFTQADISTTRKFGGTGLGLSICRQLAGLMKGEVTARSIPGKGSVFSTTLVLKRDLNTSPECLNSSDYVILNGKTALIVDDSAPSRTIISAMLSDVNVNSTGTDHPQKALQILAEAKNNSTPFDVLVTDYLMPEMQSTPFTMRVKELYPHMPIMMVTALAGKGYSQIFASSGCDAYLTKPIRSSQFLNLLAMIFKARQENKNLNMLTPLAVFRKSSYRKGEHDNSFIEGAHILLAEDNRANRDLVIKILDNMGCKTTAVRDGEEAINLVQKQPFDLILMDCQMPEMDGFQASNILRQMKRAGEIPDIPIIALTANAMKGDREKSLESGMNDYINKPLRKSALRNAFMHWLPSKEKRHNNNSYNI